MAVAGLVVRHSRRLDPARAALDLAGLLAAGIEVRLGVDVSVRHLQAGCLAPDVA